MMKGRDVAFVFIVACLALGMLGGAVHIWAQQPPPKPVNDDSDHHPPANVDRVSQQELLKGAPPQPEQAEPVMQAAIVGQVPAVYTHSYDNLRSGTNRNETKLTPNSVKAGLKQLFTVSIAGDKRGTEAQPLLAPSVLTADGMLHDVLVLATMGNQVAAFDAHDGTPLWLTRVGNPITGSRNIDAWLVNDKWGILSTGVIKDAVLYVVAWTSPDGTPAKSSHWLYALSLKDGSRVKAPLRLVPVNATMQRKQRAALTVVGNTIFIPWGTVQETANGAHGYITAVDIPTWRITTELNLTPTGKGAGVWQAGQGLVADAEGFLYAMTGNGDYDGIRNFGESFIKVRYANNTLSVIDHYSPFRDADRAQHFEDMDLGSGGPSLIPELGLLFGAGKDGILYQLPWRRLRQPTIPSIWFTFFPGPGIPAIPQDKLFFDRTHHMHSSPVTWKTAAGEWRMFVWGENGNLRAWRVTAQGVQFLANGAEVSSVNSPTPPGGMPGGFMALTANGGNNGVLWATVPFGDANRTVTQGYLAAYDASNFGTYPGGGGAINLLWKSDTFVFNKFNPPVAAGGKVYVPTYDGKVIVYGQ